MNHHQSLVKNENMMVNFQWELWAPEVDALAKLIKGRKAKITEEEIQNYLQGVLDALILQKVNVEQKRLAALKALQRDGRSEAYIKSYMRGWDSVNTVLENEQNKTSQG